MGMLVDGVWSDTDLTIEVPEWNKNLVKESH